VITSLFRRFYHFIFGPTPTLTQLLQEDLHHAERNRLTSVTKEEELTYKLACQRLATQHYDQSIARIKYDLAADAAALDDPQTTTLARLRAAGVRT
jgi:hypothetical protein